MNTKIDIKGFAHVALAASDFEKSLAFYERLGFKNILQWGEGRGRICLLDCGNGQCLELFARGDDGRTAEGRFFHVAFEVADVQKAFDTAVAAGAKPTIAPKSVSPDSAPVKAVIHCAFVEGPDGEALEFFRLEM